LSSYPIAPAPFAPLPSTFASRCPIHHLRHSHRWLVVAFSARPEKSLTMSLSQENHPPNCFSCLCHGSSSSCLT
jgi:hypothetical protein